VKAESADGETATKERKDQPLEQPQKKKEPNSCKRNENQKTTNC
jgi:hypothetical protein